MMRRMRWMQGWMMGLVLASATTVGAVPYAWIANQGSESVSRLDLATNLNLTTTVGNSPFGVAAVPDGSLAFVGNTTDSTISIIDGETVSVVATVPLTAAPQGLAVTPDGAKLYVARQDGVVDVIDVASATVLTSIPGGSPSAFVLLEGVAVHPSGGLVYITKTENSTMSVLVIDTILDAVVADIFIAHDGHFGLGLTVTSDGTRVYATFMSSGMVYAIDTATNLLVDVIPLSCPSGCSFVAAVTGIDGSLLYVGMPGAIAIVETSTGDELTIPMPDSFPSGADVSPDGSTVYVIDQNAGEIALIDTATNTQIGTLLAVGMYPTGFGKFIVPGTPPTTTTVSTTSSTSTSTTTTTTTTTTNTTKHDHAAKPRTRPTT